MLRVNTDKDWTRFGVTDPYCGVFGAERFELKNVDVALVDAALLRRADSQRRANRPR